MNAIWVLVSFLALASAGRPPTAEEQRLYDEGMRAFGAGDARAAEKAWKAGYQVGKDAAFLVHIGEAEEKAGDLAAAADSYRRYLRDVPDAADRAEIEQRLVRVSPAAPGPAAPEAETPGAFGDAPAAAPAATPAPPRAAAPAAPARDNEAARRRAAEEPSGWNAYNITAWISTAAAVTLLGTAGYLAASAGSQKDDVNQLLRFRDPITGAPLEYATVAQRYTDATNAGRRDDRWAKTALIGAAAGAGVAAVFFTLDALRGDAHERTARADSRARFDLALAPDGRSAAAAASLGWSF
jgi:hypothetical protein